MNAVTNLSFPFPWAPGEKPREPKPPHSRPRDSGPATTLVVTLGAGGTGGARGVGTLGGVRVALGGSTSTSTGVVGVALGGALLAVARAGVGVGTGGGSGGGGSGGVTRRVEGGVGGAGLDGGGLADDGRGDHLGDLVGGGDLGGGALVLVGGDGGGEVLLVLLDLRLHVLEGLGRGDLRGDVGLGLAVGLLDGEAATCGFARVSFSSSLSLIKTLPGTWEILDVPKGPARALLRQRTVQMLPVEPPVQFMVAGMVTVMLKSWVLAWEKPLAPGTLLVTVRGVWPVTPRLLPVGSMSQVYGPAPSALTWWMVTVIWVPAVTLVTAPAARAFSVFSPTSMLPAISVRPHSLTTLVRISSSRMRTASCWQGLMLVQFLARFSTVVDGVS